MIPSTPVADESSSNDKDSESSGGSGKGHEHDADAKKHVVPVMRRHGEPLMVMPEWQSTPANEHDDARSNEYYQSELVPSSSERYM